MSNEVRALETLETKISQKVLFLARVERRNKVVLTTLMTFFAWNVYLQSRNWYSGEDVVRGRVVDLPACLGIGCLCGRRRTWLS